MIWSEGKIFADDWLSIPISDRTFEHGLGLFETFRTWGGRPTLLERHKARMLRSAAELDLPIDPASLPDAEAVRMLLEVEGVAGDRLLRITATGGTSTNPSIVWMKTGPLPEPLGEQGAHLLYGSWEVSSLDEMARHKTLNYWSRRRAFEEARSRGFDEALSLRTGIEGLDLFFEGSRTNLFVVLNRRISFFGARRPVLMTSSTAAPIVPGILREIVIDLAAEASLDLEESPFGIDTTSLVRSREVFLTNSVRGIIPVRRLYYARTGHQFFLMHWQAPGPVTARLQEALARRLWPDLGGESP